MKVLIGAGIALYALFGLAIAQNSTSNNNNSDNSSSGNNTRPGNLLFYHYANT